MKSDTPDELFVFPDHVVASTDMVQPDFDPDCRKREDYFLATLPWVPKTFFEDDLPF